MSSRVLIIPDVHTDAASSFMRFFPKLAPSCSRGAFLGQWTFAIGKARGGGLHNSWPWGIFIPACDGMAMDPPCRRSYALPAEADCAKLANLFTSVALEWKPPRHVDSMCEVVADHPHAGGEFFCLACWASVALGSSPRGWGEPSRGDQIMKPIRTIPTQVGSTRGKSFFALC